MGATKYCPNCGQPIGEGEKFCRNCGMPIVSNVEMNDLKKGDDSQNLERSQQNIEGNYQSSNFSHDIQKHSRRTVHIVVVFIICIVIACIIGFFIGRQVNTISYDTEDKTKKIYYTVGHEEDDFSDTVLNLFSETDITTEEIDLSTTSAVPEDCGLLFMYAPKEDITDDELEIINAYMADGGEVFLILSGMDEKASNLDSLLSTYGMQMVDGYIADTQRYYQDNPFYIFPVITEDSEFTEGMSTDMVLLVEARGMTLTDPERDTITVEDFMTTSGDGYAVTEDDEVQGTYVLGAVAKENLAESKSNNKDSSQTESRLTVITSESIIDSGITDYYTTLENLDLFMNTVCAGFPDVEPNRLSQEQAQQDQVLKDQEEQDRLAQEQVQRDQEEQQRQMQQSMEEQQRQMDQQNQIQQQIDQQNQIQQQIDQQNQMQQQMFMN